MWVPDRAIDRLRLAAELPDTSGTRYQVIERIGRGGMGSVYRAHDTLLDRPVALKVIHHDVTSPAVPEALVLARIEHPGIVPVHDAGVLPDGRAFYAMKLVEGARLDEYARRSSLAEVIRTLQRVAETVAFANSRGVVHRDLKPANIMVGSFGEVLVLDWGLAVRTGESGEAAGTEGFMAPEQKRGDALTPASDIFSLGAILARLSDGGERPAPPLRSIIRMATQAEPDGRYRSALEFAADLNRFLDGEPVLAHRESIAERIGRLIARHHTAILLVMAYLVMRTVFALFFRH